MLAAALDVAKLDEEVEGDSTKKVNKSGDDYIDAYITEFNSDIEKSSRDIDNGNLSISDGEGEKEGEKEEETEEGDQS